ncbi:hypothetical protein WSS15_19400 [Acetobacter pasteurianus]|nr:hypothetical protein WSS15_19400 [Acetobacter pasteurianus]
MKAETRPIVPDTMSKVANIIKNILATQNANLEMFVMVLIVNRPCMSKLVP